MDAINDFFADSTLNCIYGGALALGFVYAVLLLVFQGIGDVMDGVGDLLHIFDGGMDVDVGGHDFDGDGSGLSLLAVSAFVASFGAFGLTSIGFGATPLGSFAIAALGGFVFGGLGQAFFVYILSPTTSAIVNQSRLTGLTAEVTTPVPENGVGQISMVVQGSRINYSARAYDNQPLPRGTEVRIEKIIGSVATVVPTSEFDVD
ncbi:MAG: hypothetical protein L0154_14185 [Chloroflexi bacterium]|nr:hypothetical protein [Chloroflexota bacterium]